MSSYSDLLRHPEWQKRRLEILGRDGFECQSCGETEKTLHVHHDYYARDRKPWEYPAESLHTLCEDCHATVEAERKRLWDLVRLLQPGDHSRVAGYVLARLVSRGTIPAGEIANGEELEGVSEHFLQDSRQVFSVLDRGEGHGLVLTGAATWSLRERLFQGETEA